MTERSRKRVLFMPEGSVLAHVGRALAVAHALDHDAFEIEFASEGEHACWLKNSGYPLRPVYTRERSELLARLRSGGSAFDVDTLRKYVDDELQVLDETKPDVIVGDFRSSLSISAQVRKIPYVCVTNAVWTKYVSFNFDPPASWRLTRIFGKRLLRPLVSVLEKPVFAHYAKPFNAVRCIYGLPKQDDVRDCMCSEDLTLLADVPEFFPTENLPSHFKYVGPILWEPQNGRPEWWERLDTSDTRRKIVYLTMGSTGPQERVREIVLELIEAGYQVICTTAERDCTRLARHDRCFPSRYLPGSRICEIADVVVCHAGNGTIYQALSHGAPVVGVPEFHDQDFNMQRVTALGMGISVKSGPSLAEGVAKAVRELLSNRQFADEARAFQRLLKSWSGAEEAAVTIREFLKTRGPAT